MCVETNHLYMNLVNVIYLKRANDLVPSNPVFDATPKPILSETRRYLPPVRFKSPPPIKTIIDYICFIWFFCHSYKKKNKVKQNGASYTALNENNFFMRFPYFFIRIKLQSNTIAYHDIIAHPHVDKCSSFRNLGNSKCDKVGTESGNGKHETKENKVEIAHSL